MSAPVEQLGKLWARSTSMRTLFAEIRTVAATSTPVVIEGETGTGKELIAEAILGLSDRAANAYRVVDCASVASGQLESELFGHVRGAFPGAVTDHTGAFEEAHRGTVFIDELGELPPALQTRLLRVLEKSEVKRVGAETTRKIDVRVLAATDRSLAREVEEGRFRRDLYFRLGAVRLHLPPLRNRPEDIELLAERFLEEIAGPETPIQLGNTVRERLRGYAWPGNVRELRNVINRGAALSDAQFRLPDDFGGEVELDGAGGRAPGPGVSLGDTKPPADAILPISNLPRGECTRPLWIGRTYKEAKSAVIADFEWGYVRALLEEHAGNVSAAARSARIHRNILHRMIARYGIKR